MRKVANKQAEQAEKQDPFWSLQSLWVLDSDQRCFVISYIFKQETWSSFILNCCEQIWGVEKAALVWSALGDT